MEEILNKIKDFQFSEKFDLVVAIGRGGVVPGYLISQKLGLDLEILGIKFRNDQNEIIFEEPQIVGKINSEFSGKNIILVDDVSRTGKTFALAKKYLNDAGVVKTLAINGLADYSIYNEECFKFPWIL